MIECLIKIFIESNIDYPGGVLVFCI